MEAIPLVLYRYVSLFSGKCTKDSVNVSISVSSGHRYSNLSLLNVLLDIIEVFVTCCAYYALICEVAILTAH